MAYDSKRKSVLLFGGYSTEHTWLTDLWRWKDGAWTQLCGEGTDCAAPDATFGETAGLAYDSRRDRLVLFGGYKTWEWDGGAWSLVHDTGKPGDDGFAAPPVYRYLTAAMAFDSAAGVTLLFSASDARLTRYDELWAWDGVSWQVICGGDTGCNGPEDRYGASITYDSRNQRLLMYGGVTSSSDQELWQWKDGAWTLLCGQ